MWVGRALPGQPWGMEHKGRSVLKSAPLKGGGHACLAPHPAQGLAQGKATFKAHVMNE